MGILKIVLTYLLTIYLVILVGRMIFSWVQMFARQWTPTGILLVIAESIYTVTDPPLKFLRRYIPSLRIGTVAMDLSFMVLFIVILILLDVVVPRI
ncbi:MAG TPA: YggT family protein [Streptosporangiaceae bacterium]|jgi:YggT family protein|nr:YggT family protein [Streptosporangiaceae bacterium]